VWSSVAFALVADGWRVPTFGSFAKIVLLVCACHDARVASSPTSQSGTLAGPAIRRALASACVAGGLGLLFWLVFHIGSRSLIKAGDCGGGPWGCLFVGIVAVLAGILVIVVVAWPLLRAVGVRPAWPVALVGPIIAMSAYPGYLTLAYRSQVPGLWILLALSYAAAAVVTAPHLYRYWSAAVGMTVIVLDLATRFLAGRSPRS
jgi:hypothetical protein